MIMTTFKRIPLVPLVLMVATLGTVVGAEVPSVQAAAVTTVVNFDDLPGENAGQDVPVPDGYGGITWNNQWNYFGREQAPYNPASGKQRAYTRDLEAAFFFKTAPVVFNGAFFSGFNVSAPRFELYLQNQFVASSQSLIPSEVSTFLASGYAGLVDEVRVIEQRGGTMNFNDGRVTNFPTYVMDDVTYTTDSIPSPALLPGLIGFGVVLWRKKLGVRPPNSN
jgi:hypothetical protein